MKYSIFIIVDLKNNITAFTSSYFVSNPNDYYIKIGESDDPYYYEQYITFDDLGVPNYKYVDGEIVERTDEEKAPERKAKQEAVLQKRYIPTLSVSVNAFVQNLILKESAGFDADMKIKTSGVYKDWALGKYEVGDIRNHAGQTWECWTAHDNASNPDITPDKPQTWANFWRPLHGTSKETARPWVKPQNGTTDMYHIGEYMVWTDGTIKKCLRDTVYSPDEYAADWEDAE